MKNKYLILLFSLTFKYTSCCSQNLIVSNGDYKFESKSTSVEIETESNGIFYYKIDSSSAFVQKFTYIITKEDEIRGKRCRQFQITSVSPKSKETFSFSKRDKFLIIEDCEKKYLYYVKKNRKFRLELESCSLDSNF